MSTPAVPNASVLLDEASNVYHLANNTYKDAVAAGTFAAANNGTPLVPEATTQQLLNWVGGTMQNYTPSALEDILLRQLLTFARRNSTLVGSVALSGSVNVGSYGGGTATVHGAEVGDFVQVALDGDPLVSSTAVVLGVVSAANTVSVVVNNMAGIATLNLDGITAAIRVTKR